MKIKIKTFALLLISLLYLGSCNLFNDDAKPKYIDHKSENLIIVTIDGYRWQEVFLGADSLLFFNKNYSEEKQLQLNKRYWAETSEEKRKKLMPFLWSRLAENGKIYGNRNLGNKVSVGNKYWYSYPGYNEIFTGYPDKNIRNNDLINNPNKNVFEFLKIQTDFSRDIYGFTEWSGFSHIFNIERNNLNIFAGEEALTNAVETLDKDVTSAVFSNIDSLNFYNFNHKRFKDLKYLYATSKAYLKEKKPKVLYIGLGGTDYFGHINRYDYYLNTAYNTDIILEDLWDFIQNDEFYANNTTLFITTDHGRGIGNEWVNHGHNIENSNETWFAVIGPDTLPLGELSKNMQLFNYQFAQSFSHLLGYHFTSKHPVATPIPNLMDN